MKIFIIGFNKTGTRSLHHYFSKNLISSIHWDDGKLAKQIKYNHENGIKILTGYEQYTVFSDMEDAMGGYLTYAHVDYFKEFDKTYPESKFILNIRDVENWINSRNYHANGKYTENICKKLNLTKEEVNKKWREDYYNHKKNVINYFSDKPNKLLIFDIEKDSVQKLNEFFSELQLNAKYYKHEGCSSILSKDNKTIYCIDDDASNSITLESVFISNEELIQKLSNITQNYNSLDAMCAKSIEFKKQNQTDLYKVLDAAIALQIYAQIKNNNPDKIEQGLYLIKKTFTQLSEV